MLSDDIQRVMWRVSWTDQLVTRQTYKQSAKNGNLSLSFLNHDYTDVDLLKGRMVLATWQLADRG